VHCINIHTYFNTSSFLRHIYIYHTCVFSVCVRAHGVNGEYNLNVKCLYLLDGFTGSCCPLFLSGTSTKNCTARKMEHVPHPALPDAVACRPQVDWAWKANRTAFTKSDRNQVHVMNWDNKFQIFVSLYLFTFEGNCYVVCAFQVAQSGSLCPFKLCKDCNNISFTYVQSFNIIYIYIYIYIHKYFPITFSVYIYIYTYVYITAYMKD
jgi:hypothetical protein